MQLEKKVGRIAFFREIINGSDKLVSGGPDTKQCQQKLNWLFPKLKKYSMRIIIFKLSVFVKCLYQNNRYKVLQGWDPRARIQLGWVYFGVFSTSRFAPLALSSDVGTVWMGSCGFTMYWGEYILGEQIFLETFCSRRWQKLY